MKRITNLLVLLLGFYTAFATNAEEQFKQANDAYAAKDFNKAAQLYQALVDSGYQSANLYYNLGNAYYKQGLTAEPILYYEKAKKIDPANEDINFNLKVANLKVADKVETLPELGPIKRVKDFFASHSSKGWGSAAIVFIWLAFIAATVFLFVKISLAKRISFFAGVLCVIISITAFIIAWGQFSREKSGQYGIVFATNTYVKSAPDAQSIDLFILREGVKVQFIESTGTWQKVKLPDVKGDKVGWLPKEQLREI